MLLPKNITTTMHSLRLMDILFVIDCGVTATLSLYQLQIPINRIDGIFITHLHADHIGGLEELAYQNLYLFKRKPQLFVPEKLLEPLWENSLKAGMDEPLHPGGLDRFFTSSRSPNKLRFNPSDFASGSDADPTCPG